MVTGWESNHRCLTSHSSNWDFGQPLEQNWCWKMNRKHTHVPVSQSRQGQQQVRSGASHGALVSLQAGWWLSGKGDCPQVAGCPSMWPRAGRGNTTCSGTAATPIPVFTQTALFSHFCMFSREWAFSWDVLVDIWYPTEWSLANFIFIYMYTHIYSLAKYLLHYSMCQNGCLQQTRAEGTLRGSVLFLSVK